LQERPSYALANAAELFCADSRKGQQEVILKSNRIASIVLLSLCAVAFGQSSDKPVTLADAQKDAAKPIQTSDAQKSLDLMKTLAGTWQAPIMTDDPDWSKSNGIPMSLSIRVASHGNAVIHELNTGGPEVTVFYLDSDRLTLLHYCDFGNRPHMVARLSADGKVLEFDLVDAPGSDQMGHVSHAVFTIIDANHHIEDWTFMKPDGKLVHGHMDFKRTQ
jgi:hypothetical protein